MASRILLYLLMLAVACRAAYSSDPGGVVGSNSDGGDGNNNNNGELGVPLYFAVEPQVNVVVGRGEPLFLHCVAVSAVDQVPPTITWFHQGRPIGFDDPRRHLLPNGTLWFQKVQHKRTGQSDEGEYHCVARSSIGAIVSRNASLRVAFLGRNFSVVPGDQTVEEKGVAKLSCAIDSQPPATITWEKDDLLVIPDERILVLDSGTLVIRDVQLEHAGRYRCVATNTRVDKLRKSSPGQLLVFPGSIGPQGPQLLSSPSASTTWLLPSSNASLECVVSGQPTPTIVWLHNDSQIAMPPSFSLPLLQVDQNASGVYTCLAWATLNGRNESTSLTYTVQVMTPPTILTPPLSQVFPIAKTVRFECEVGGEPNPDIRWFKDGRLLPAYGRIRQRWKVPGSVSELILSNTVTGDTGLYQCQASNKAGFTSAYARLLVNVTHTRPEPPPRLRCSTVSPTEILLAWDPSPNIPPEEFQGYSVHYARLGGDETQLVSLNTSHKVENLQPYSNYSFYVRVYSSKAASDLSERIICSTSEGSPLAAPNVTLKVLSPTTLHVSWTKLPTELARGPVTQYMIQYRRHKQKEYDIYIVKSKNVFEYTIIGLHPNKTYDVRVLPGNNKNWQEVSDKNWPWYTQQMPRAPGTTSAPGTLPLPTIRLLVYNTTAIQVVWDPVSSEKKVLGFKLWHRKVGAKLKTPITLSAQETRAVISNLDQGTVYEVQLICFTEEGDGPIAVKTIRTLYEVEEKQSIPVSDVTPPEDLKVEAISSTACHLAWPGPPESTPPTSSYYTVRYVGQSAVQGPPYAPGQTGGTHTGFMRSTDTEIDVPGLKPYTNYEFSVRYHDDQQNSPYSEPVTCLTMQDVPSSPIELGSSVVDSASVALNWLPPVNPQGVIVSYIIYLSHDPTLKVEQWTKQEETGSKLKTLLTGLLPATTYHVTMRAVTSAGPGELATPITVVVPSWGETPLESSTEESNYMGIVLGVVISLTCLLVCMGLLMWRCACVKMWRQPRRSRTVAMASGATRPRPPGCMHSEALALVAVSQINGGGHSRSLDPMKGHQAATNRNSTCIDMTKPVLPHIPADIPSHLDTKGGYPVPAGQSRYKAGEGSLPRGFVTRNSPPSLSTPALGPPCTSSVASPLGGKNRTGKSGSMGESEEQVALLSSTVLEESKLTMVGDQTALTEQTLLSAFSGTVTWVEDDTAEETHSNGDDEGRSKPSAHDLRFGFKSRRLSVDDHLATSGHEGEGDSLQSLSSGSVSSDVTPSSDDNDTGIGGGGDEHVRMRVDLEVVDMGEEWEDEMEDEAYEEREGENDNRGRGSRAASLATTPSSKTLAQLPFSVSFRQPTAS